VQSLRPKRKRSKRRRLQRNRSCQDTKIYLDLSKVTVKLGTSENVTIISDNWKIMVCEATGKKEATSQNLLPICLEP
jgi:hypothetical protein